MEEASRSRAESNRENVRRLYNDVANIYAEQFCSAKVWEAEKHYVDELLKIRSVEYPTIIDIGCGPGVYAPLALGCRYVGVDIALEMLRLGRQQNPNAIFLQGDACALPLGDGVADCAVAMGSLSHMEDAEFRRAVKEIARALRLGGGFLLGDQVGAGQRRVEYPLKPGAMVLVCARSEEWYVETLRSAGLAEVRRVTRPPERGEIALWKVVMWARRNG